MVVESQAMDLLRGSTIDDLRESGWWTMRLTVRGVALVAACVDEESVRRNGIVAAVMIEEESKSTRTDKCAE